MAERKAKPKAAGAGKEVSFLAAFGLSRNPFRTRALSGRDLDLFFGRAETADRLSSLLASLSNVGLAGEPGSGKSSLLNLLAARAGGAFRTVEVSAPVDDSRAFLQDLIGALAAADPRAGASDRRRFGNRRRLGEPGRAELLARARALLSSPGRPFLVFVDGLDKFHGDRVRHLTRADRTQQFLEELRPILESPRAAFAVALQEEFHGRTARVVSEKGDSTVLGLFEKVVLVDRLTPGELKALLAHRLSRCGWRGTPADLLEPEVLTLALSLAAGNPRRFLYSLSEAALRAASRGASRVEFRDFSEGLNEHLKLDAVCRRLLYFLAKSGRALSSNRDLQAFAGLDSASLARRFEILVRSGLAETAGVTPEGPVYALSGFARAETEDRAPGEAVRVERTASGERMWLLDPPSGKSGD